MGKGFNNYMCKKFFHPASRDNLKRVWIAEQQTEAYKKKQEELKVQYEKEQDLYTNKAMMSKESKEKLSVNFLYEPPPGTKKDREREDDEPEFKFEWQRRFNAPRESYCKGDQEIRDQPFGIQVRNVRCIKCHKWGHINTDKECPMYNQSASGSDGASNLNPSDLIRQMREDGLAMKKGAVGLLELPNGPSSTGNHQLIPSSSEDEDHMNESELKFLEGLSTKKKLKLLRKLEKIEKKKKKKKKEKKEKKTKERGQRKDSCDSDSSESNSESPETKRRAKKAAKHGSSLTKEGQNLGVNKDLENDLYTVLGRKMDFEGPPQRSSQSHSTESKTKARGVHSQSRSNGRGRSRSSSPTKDTKKSNQRAEDLDRQSDRKNRRRSRSTEGRDRIYSNRSGSPSESRKKADKGSRGRERSQSREKYRKRTRSRSREPRRRSRSPISKDYGSRHTSGSKW